MVGTVGVEDLRQLGRLDLVQLDAQRAAVGEEHRRAQAARSRGAVLLEQSDGMAGIGAHLVHASLLAVEFFDDDEGDDDVVFVEAERSVGIGEQDAGVEHVGRGHCYWAPRSRVA